MAATRAVVRGRIQELLGDMNPSERVVVQFRYEEIINSNMHRLAARCQMQSQNASSITLVADTYEYTVADTTAQAVSQAFLNSDGAELVLVPWEQFNAYYRQATASPRASGTPREYTMREDVSGLLRLRFGPTPDASDTAKVQFSEIPTSLTTDASSVPFSNDLMSGFIALCAAEVVLMLPPDKLAALGLDKSVASKWMGDVDRVVRDYNVRMGNLGGRQDRVARHGGRRAGSGHEFWGVW